ncbi:MAG: hypothetical protein P8L40_05205 [Planktomarina sp.]|jgi:5'-deoxynucleotidase YfbR-like HD superfamily hydrolase|nr:hypothetical protein [Planktomarina sp.]
MAQPRAWQRMLSGRRLDLLDPAAIDIEVEDIAHGLAFLARWNGQTIGEFPYSVAEHSLLVEKIFRRLNPKSNPEQMLIALLHDAPEYVIGDMISPVKASVGLGYNELDKRLAAAIHIRFGLSAITPKVLKKKIKKADKISAWLEATQLAGFSDSEANKLFGQVDAKTVEGLNVLLRPPVEVRLSFAKRHSELLDQL